MRRFMMLAGLALVASLALAGAAAASATAAEIVLNTGSNFPQAILGSSNKPSELRTASGSKVVCQTLTNTGTVYSKKDILISLLWHTCTETLFGNTCQTAGEPAGLIHDAVLALPVLVTTHLPALLFQLDTSFNKEHIATFNCGALAQSIVNGTVIGTITSPKVEEFSNEMNLSVEVKTPGSEQKYTKAEGSAEEDKLMSSLDGGKFESSTEEVNEDKSHFNTSGVTAKFTG